MRITLKKVRIIPEKIGFQLIVDITLIHSPNWRKYAEILEKYRNKEFGLWGLILMGLKVWAGIKRR